MMALCIDRDFNGFYFNGLFVAKELVTQIITCLDIAGIRKAREVCKQWRFIVDDPLFWKHKCERDGQHWPHVPLTNEIPWNFYASIYVHKPLGRNLIKNPNGKGTLQSLLLLHLSSCFFCLCGTFSDKLEHWNVLSRGGDGFAFEQPPAGADTVPQEAAEDNDVAGESSCFATSYHSCSKEQIIDLDQLGIPCEVMDKYKPCITFKDWYIPLIDHHDFSNLYNITFALVGMQAGLIVVASMKQGFRF